jgi:hypothetical protein
MWQLNLKFEIESDGLTVEQAQTFSAFVNSLKRRGKRALQGNDTDEEIKSLQV